MRARIKVSAFTQGVTVADLLRGLLEREFPNTAGEHTMNASASPAAGAATAAPRHLPAQPASAPLTRVSLAYIEHRFKLYLRFGEPARTHRLDRWRAARCSCRTRFLPHPLAGQRLRHDPLAAHGDAGLHAAGRGAAHPRRAAGRALLLHAEGEQSVRAVLERIDAIEALGIAPAASPAYWRTLANRLAARLPLPEYTAERHAAWLIGRALP
jgi:hypothetical protein